MDENEIQREKTYKLLDASEEKLPVAWTTDHHDVFVSARQQFIKRNSRQIGTDRTALQKEDYALGALIADYLGLCSTDTPPFWRESTPSSLDSALQIVSTKKAKAKLHALVLLRSMTSDSERLSHTQTKEDRKFAPDDTSSV